MWTPERIEELMRLLKEGRTSYELAAHFKTTRNAICGKIHRERVKRGIIMAAPRIRDRSKERRKKMLTLPDRAESVSLYVAPKPVEPDLGQLVSIVDVTGCKWPVRDDSEFVGGIACCNHMTADGASYCAYHAAQSVSKTQPKPIMSIGALGLRFGKRAA